MTRDARAMVAFHAAFFLASGLTSLQHAPGKGWTIVALVVAYNVCLPLIARALGRQDWVKLWAFLLPVSVFQVLPDWFLAGGLGTLRFPVVGGPRLGHAISLAMCGMWVPPLWIAMTLARGRAGVAATLATVVFLGSELMAPMLKLWEPTDLPTQVAGVALYVLPAEAALGWATAIAFAHLPAPSWSRRVPLALAVSTFYLGALALAYFLIDSAQWSIAL